MSLKKLSHEINEVGKTIKSSKLHFIWEFVLDSQYHRVELFHSKLSGKKKMSVDSRVLFQNKDLNSNLSFSFLIDKTYFNMVQINEDSYDLRLGNEPFAYWTQESTFQLIKGEKRLEKPSKQGYQMNNVNDDFYSQQQKQLEYYTSQKNNNNIKQSKTAEVKPREKQYDFSDIMNDINSNPKIKTLHAFNRNKQILDGLDLFDEDQQQGMNQYQKNYSQLQTSNSMNQSNNISPMNLSSINNMNNSQIQNSYPSFNESSLSSNYFHYPNQNYPNCNQAPHMSNNNQY